MTVKEIFELRKQGRIEEAYEAIRPIYATHKGRYTTLCMMWVGADMFKLRIEQGRVDEAEKIYLALQRLIPSIEDDNERSAAGFMRLAESKLIKASEKFRKRYFAIKRKKDVPQISQKPQKGAIPVASEEIKISAISAISAGQKDESVPSVGSVRPNVSAGQNKVLECIRVNPGLRVPRISEGLNIPSKSIERHVKALIALGLIEHRGSKKTGGYFAL
jgi:predicted HTH transcriptional regulator